jgi:hypothetical protein
MSISRERIGKVRQDHGQHRPQEPREIEGEDLSPRVEQLWRRALAASTFGELASLEARILAWEKRTTRAMVQRINKRRITEPVGLDHPLMPWKVGQDAPMIDRLKRAIAFAETRNPEEQIPPGFWKAIEDQNQSM